MSAELVSDEEMDFWSKAALVNISILRIRLAFHNQESVQKVGFFDKHTIRGLRQFY